MPRNKFVFSWCFAFFWHLFTLRSIHTSYACDDTIPRHLSTKITGGPKHMAFGGVSQMTPSLFKKLNGYTVIFTQFSKKNSKRVWSSTQADTSRLFMDAVPLPLHVEAFVCSLSGLEPIHLSLDDLDPRHSCQWPMSTRSLARTSSQHRREHRTVIPERTPSH